MTNLIAVFAMMAGLAQTPLPEAQNQGGGEVAVKAERSDGLWPSEKLLGLMLARIADQMTERYGMPEKRREEVRDAFVNRWSVFLDQNRDRLEPLANEFLEMRLELTPPDKKRVQEWAGRTRPVFERIEREVRASQESVGGALDPAQRAKFVAESLAMEVGLQFAKTKLAQYEAGEFEDVDFWQPHGMDRDARQRIRKARREERRAIVEAIRENQPPVDQIRVELSAWEQFTRDFIRIYDLDEGQRTAALSCLKELTDRANSHRDRHRGEIERLEKRISLETATHVELNETKEKLVSLYGPIDEMFLELKSRLETLPTSDQRARVLKVRSD